MYSGLSCSPSATVATQESYNSDANPPSDSSLGGDEGHQRAEPRKQGEGETSEKENAIIARRRSQNRDA